MNRPKSHHYVPQHHLRRWASDSNKKKIWRHRFLKTGKYEIKEVSIESSCEEKLLYSFSNNEEMIIFEDTFMAPEVDAPGYVITEKIIRSGMQALSEKEREEYAEYLGFLQARHPDTISQMNLTDHDLDQMYEHLMKLTSMSDSTKNWLNNHIKKLKKSGTGSLNSYLIMLQEKNKLPFNTGVAQIKSFFRKKKWSEMNFGGDVLITSDYPFSSNKSISNPDSVFSFSVSPSKAALFFPNIKDAELFRPMSANSASMFINFFTLSLAKEAYTSSPDKSGFIECYIGWRHKGFTADWFKEQCDKFMQHTPEYCVRR